MKAVYETLSDIPEAFRAEYVEKAGKYLLKVEGDYAPLVEANTKLAEFRDNNRTLNTKLTETTTELKKFEGIDPVEHTKLKAKVTELETSGVKDKGDVAALVTKAVAAAVLPFQEKLTAREASEAAAQTALAKSNLQNAIRAAGLKAGVDERALPDYIARGEKVFVLVDGEPVARKGEAPIFSKLHPDQELTIDQFAIELQNEAPFLYKPSKGGGAGNGGVPGSGGPRKIISSDPVEFGKNLESIAKGETIVQQ